MARLPAGIREKLRRAHLHSRDFDRRVQRFLDPKPYRLVPEDDPQTGECRWRVDLLRQPPLVRWSALAGDCLYDLRSALDQLAYALAVAYTGDPLPRHIADQSAFPLFRTKPKRVTTLNRKIVGMHPK